VNRWAGQSHAYLASAVLLPLVLLAGMGQVQGRECTAEDKILPTAREVGGMGGSPFDDRSYANFGEITKIEIGRPISSTPLRSRMATQVSRPCMAAAAGLLEATRRF
jgi:hypothetical protein